MTGRANGSSKIIGRAGAGRGVNRDATHGPLRRPAAVRRRRHAGRTVAAALCRAGFHCR